MYNNVTYLGELECLRYAHEHGCIWDDKTFAGAASNNHLNCLECCHQNNCPWNSTTFIYATGECRKYVIENICSSVEFYMNEDT